MSKVRMKGEMKMKQVETEAQIMAETLGAELSKLSEPELAKPHYWRPKVGERLIGKVISRHQVRGRFGSREAVTVKRADGAHRTVVLTAVLASKLGDVAPGYWVAVQFLGKEGIYLNYSAFSASPEQVKELRGGSQTKEVAR